MKFFGQFWRHNEYRICCISELVEKAKAEKVNKTCCHSAIIKKVPLGKACPQLSKESPQKLQQ